MMTLTSITKIYATKIIDGTKHNRTMFAALGSAKNSLLKHEQNIDNIPLMLQFT
jgi:hypothetical protein